MIELCVNEELNNSPCRGFSLFKEACALTNVSIVITDKNGNISYINDAACNLTGYTREEILGKNPRIFKSGLQPDEVYKNLWNTITKGGIWEGEMANKKKDGSIYWEFARITKFEFNGDVFYLGIKEDITKMKKLKERVLELEKTTKELHDV